MVRDWWGVRICMATKLIYLVQAGLHLITESLSYVTVSLIYLDACASVCGHDVININAYTCTCSPLSCILHLPTVSVRLRLHQCKL